MKVWHLVGGRPIGPTYDVRRYNPESFLTEEELWESRNLDPYGMEWEETTLEEVLARYRQHCEFEADREGLKLEFKFDPNLTPKVRKAKNIGEKR